MRRAIKYSAVISLVVCASFALAGGYDYTKEDMNGYILQPDQASDGDDYGRNGHAFYLYGGYVYTARFLRSSLQTITILPGGTTLSYSPKNVVPSTFSGLEIGFGKEMTQHFDLQMDYIQQFKATKNSTYQGNAYNYSTKMNGLLLDVAYIFNPDDQFQVFAQMGTMVSQFTNNISVNGSTYYRVSDSTKIDPAGGLGVLFQFSKSLAFRVNGLYVAETQGTNSDGEVNAFAGLSYTLES